MNNTRLPLLIEPDVLEEARSEDNLLIVDIGKPATYAQLHIPGAVHLDYPLITAARKPVMGLLPDAASLTAVLSAVGISEQTHVVAYDDEGGGCAARLLWTLECAGHRHYSLLNGGLHAWANEGHAHAVAPETPVAGRFQPRPDDRPLANSEYIVQRLGDPDTRLLDVRSPAEYSGVRKFATRGGHIPGAVNIEWTQLMDRERNLRFLPDDRLTDLLEAQGITPDREVITYCQTHHRSAHTWLVLKYLGFVRLKAYPGSWSDWGNNPDLPVET